MLLPFFSWLPLEQQRKLALRKCDNNVLATYLRTPLADLDLPIKKIELASLDFETTGLNAKKDQLLSIGLVNIQAGKIDLSSSWHQVINIKGQLNNKNVVIHQITDDEKSRGMMLKQAFDQLLPRLAGKVVLVHFAQIEREFLQQACIQLYGTKAPFILIDTLEIACRYFKKRSQLNDPSQFRLNNLRRHFSLPAYPEHHALNDAIATAELFLAELNHWYQGTKTRLRPLI